MEPNLSVDFGLGEFFFTVLYRIMSQHSGKRKQSTKPGVARRGSTLTDTGKPQMGRHGSVSYSFTRGSTKNDPLGEQMEFLGMHRAEAEQRSNKDAFWGVDKEAADRNLDRALMTQEFELSSAQEMLLKTKDQEMQWEEQYQAKLHDEAYRAAVKEMKVRRDYMQRLFAAETSQEVMSYVWNPDAHVPPLPVFHSPGRGGGSLRPGGAQRLEESINDSMSGASSFVKILGGSTFDLPPLDHEYQRHLHLDGLQQSKALASAQVQQGLGTSLRNRSSTAGVAEGAMSSSRKGGSAKTKVGGAGGMGVSMGGGVTVTPLVEAGASFANPADKEATRFKLTTTSGKATVLPPPASRKHNPYLDGHPKYGWDQEAALAAAFDLLDTSRTGRLSMEHVSHIAKNTEVQALLRYTVLGSTAKKKNWQVFRSMFPYEEAYIGVNEWLAAANTASAEHRVSLHLIRTEDMHIRIVNSQQPNKDSEVGWQWLVSSSAGAKKAEGGWFAENARALLFRREQQAMLKNGLRSGDVVWALHGRGVVWMQAVVESVNEADGACDLIYPLSPVTISRLRESSMTRKLVRQSYQSGNQPKSSSSGNQRVESAALGSIQSEMVALAEKSLPELHVCGAVFDFLFGERAPQFVSAILLISGLYNPTNGIRLLVDGNTILSSIAPRLSVEVMDRISQALATFLSSPTQDAALRQDLFPPLAQVFCNSFRAQEYQITKADFCSFCTLVRDRGCYQ